MLCYILALGAPVGLEAFAGQLYFLSENNGTLYKISMFDPLTISRPMLTGLPKTNDLKLHHPLKVPGKGLFQYYRAIEINANGTCDTFVCQSS